MKELTQINGNMVDLHKELQKKCRETEELSIKLDELTREMNQFTYIVSHDLQAPLRTITGFMDLLERRYSDKLDDAAKQFIGYAVKGAAKMKDLVFDLLEYSRLNTSIKEMTETDLNIVIDEVVEKHRDVINRTGAIITTETLPVVMASKMQMTQLLDHLLDNALKFRGEAVPEINITLKKENDYWIIGVKDNGIGIDPAFFEKIFIVFRRLYSDETKYSGTGIGLAICKKIVELHRGTIGVESAVNKGSTFYFSIPVTK